MLSIIIPTYNEKENIVILIPLLEKNLKGEHEIIVVDDNSPDGTAAAAETFPGVRVVRRESKAGLTRAVLAGAAAANGELLLIMDADLSHPPEAVSKMLEAMGKADLVIGSRLIAGGGVEHWPFHRKLISKGADLLARLVLGVRASDPLSGFFLMKISFFKKTRFRTKGYKLLLNILADNPKIKIAEIPYVFKDRYSGKTKLGYGEMFTYILDLLRIRVG
jgi:dolichol-phosphate mannosyltransferase